MAGIAEDLGKGFTVGRALRSAWDERKYKDLQRQAIDLTRKGRRTYEIPEQALHLGGPETPSTSPAEQGVQTQPGTPLPQEQSTASEQQTYKAVLPQAMLYDSLLEMGIKNNVDMDKWTTFVETRRNKNVLTNLKRSLMAFQTNPQQAARSFSEAMGHINVPVFAQPDGQGNLIAYALDPETGEVTSGPKKVDEEYVYKLKKYYEDKYDFGVNKAKAEAYKAEAGPKAKNPVDVDWEKFSTRMSDLKQDIQDGAFGRDASEVFTAPSMFRQLEQWTKDLYTANLNYTDPVSGEKVYLDPKTLAAIPMTLYMRTNNAIREAEAARQGRTPRKTKVNYNGPDVDITAMRNKQTGETAFFARVGDYTMVRLPSSLIAPYKRLLELTGRLKAPQKAEKPAAEKAPVPPQKEPASRTKPAINIRTPGAL